jgi:hypothetical protein
MALQKKPYKTPQLIVHGDVEVLTQENKNVLTRLDKDFPTGTPFKDLTFT